MDWSIESFQTRVLDPKKLALLEDLQLKILENGFKLAKTGGEIFYATCSLSKNQNENIISRFLNKEEYAGKAVLRDAFENFKPEILEKIKQNMEALGISKGCIEGTYRFKPNSMSTGGLFLAKIVKLI